MQRMFNLDKWERLKEGEGLEFSNPRPRNVRLEVNAPVRTALYVVDPEGEVHFLALVEGRDTVEWGSSGAFQLTVEGADVMVYTADGADIAQRVIAPVIFTKIAERRRRNPELEYIAHQMQLNMERRLEQQAGELEQLFIRRAALAAAQSVPVASGPEPTTTDGAGSPDPSATTANGGDTQDVTAGTSA